MSSNKVLAGSSLTEENSIITRGTALSDMLFLTFVTLFLQGYYLFGLGFYSDDWSYLGMLTNSKYTGIVGLAYNFFLKPEFLLRPIQTLQLAILDMLTSVRQRVIYFKVRQAYA